MQKQTINPAEKLLLIERDEDDYTPLLSIPDEYLHLLLPYSGAYFYRDEDCDMLCQHIRVKEFSIWGHDIFAKNYIILNPRTPRHILALHYMHEDTIDAVIDQVGPFHLKEKQVNLFSLRADFHSAALDRGNKIFSFHINLRPEMLPELAKKYPILQHLASFDLDNIIGPVNTVPYQINAVCTKILERIFTCKYIELQAECYLYRCCVDLYQNFAIQDAQSRLAPGSTHIPPAALMMDVFNLIVNNIQRRFTVKELAAKFGMTEAGLSKSFEQVFATPVTDFILQQRMANVYNLLLRTKASLSNIAWKAGYQNRFAMVSDFEAYFEYDPIAIRNAQ